MDKEKEKKNADPRGGAKALGPLVQSQRFFIASSNE